MRRPRSRTLPGSFSGSFALRRRLAALVALAVLAVVVSVAEASWAFTRHQLERRTDSTLTTEANSVTAQSFEVSFAASGRLGGLLVPCQLITSQGEVVARPTGQAALPISTADTGVALHSDSRVFQTYSVNGVRYRMITVPASPGYALQVAQDLESQDAALHKLALLLTFLCIGGAAAGAFIGVGVARAGLRPVRDLTRAAERVAQTDDLSSPITVRPTGAKDDEVVRLAAAFNTMLGALAVSRDRQRQLVADAGHELRTPLTSMRTNLELLVREDPAAGKILPAEDRLRLMNDLTAQIEEMTTLVGELTALARDEGPSADVELVDLADVTARAVERVRRRAPEVRLVAELESSPVLGAPVLLERAVTNLLDNAVKWSPAGGEVFAGLRGGELVVVDQGPGISDEDLPHVFERFYRARAARELPGSGLGLSIVAKAALEHGGAASAERAPGGGTLVRLRIPLAAPSVAAVETPDGSDTAEDAISGRQPV